MNKENLSRAIDVKSTEKTGKWLQYVNLKNLWKNWQMASVCEFEKSTEKQANGFSI